MMDHWPLWIDFVRAETSAHGPDPQFELLLELAPEQSEIEKVWLAGCYGAHHCVPSAFAVWREFRPRNVVRDPTPLFEWLQYNWAALPVRPEMRSHRMVAKRHLCLLNFAEYALSESWRTGSYNVIWEDSISEVKFYSRYMAIKYLELLRRIARPDMVLSDMRAKNAWSPRIALGLLWPEVANIIGDKQNNTPNAIALAEECATRTIKRLEEREITISYFQLQVMLCEYREALVGGFYDGGGHDEEMDYIKIAESKFDMTHVWETRKRIFKHEYLGELNGWFGIRKERYQEWKAKGKAMGFT
jgi:hypothetical protein